MNSTNRPLDAATRRQLARDARDAFPPMGVHAIVDRTTGYTRVVARDRKSVV